MNGPDRSSPGGVLRRSGQVGAWSRPSLGWAWAPETGRIRSVHIPAKVDYGMRALLALADRGEPATAEALAEAQGLPARFLGAILIELRRAGIVSSQRGSEG